MAKWVQNLCSVCGLKPDDNPTDLPPPNEKNEVKPAAASFVTPATLNSHHSPPVTSQPRGVTATTKAVVKGSPYIPLEECHSGKPVSRSLPIERHNSVDSVPDEPAPPPPVRHGRDNFDQGNDVFVQSEAYDFPPPRIHDVNEEDELYRSPPSRNIPQEPYDTLPPTTLLDTDTYDIPPLRQSPSTPRSSSSESQKVDSAYSSSTALTSDNPPPRCESVTQDDVYDFPRSNNPTSLANDLLAEPPPPARPPRPKLPELEPYQNIPTSSKSFSSMNMVIPTHGRTVLGVIEVNSTYDTPPSKQTEIKGSSNLSMTVPPPRPHIVKGTQHRYVNAATGYLDDGNLADTEDNYLPMEKAFPNGGPDGHQFGSKDDSAFGDMYTDMTHTVRSVYDHPPPCTRPVPARRAPARPQGSESDDTYSIFSNARTRSFKRHGSSSSSSASKEYANTSGHPPPIQRPDGGHRLMVQLPQRSDNRHPDFSTSSDDEDGVLVDSRQLCGVGWNNVPAPKMKPDGELKYLDLALDEMSDKEPMRSPGNAASHSSPTEYKEIDFVKTQALSAVKKWVELRKDDEH